MLSESEIRERIENMEEDDLDIELRDQPSLFLAASDLYVEALDKKDFHKSELRRIEADLWFKHRKRYEAMDSRPTDKVISMEVARDEEYIDAVSRLMKAQRKANKLYGLKEDLQQRSQILGKMVALFTSGYWLGDSVMGGKKTEEYKHGLRRRKMADKRRNKPNRVSPRSS